MPKKSKKKDKNPGSTKNKVGSDVPSPQNCNVQYLEKPIQADTDPNEYRVIVLPNGLVALLISCPADPSVEKDDRTTPTTARNLSEMHTLLFPSKEESTKNSHKHLALCSLCVNVGSFSDPRQLPGASHILGGAIVNLALTNKSEMSSESKNILRRTGRTSTCAFSPHSETTIFKIRINHRGYHEAIKCFAQSFESITIPKRRIEDGREMILEFVDSFERDLNMDEVDQAHIFSQCVPRRHPAKTFDENYLESVQHLDLDKMYREVQKFRKRHYSAHRMTVMMKAVLPLDTLEAYAKECFSNIANNGLPPQVFDPYNFANSVENAKFRRIWRVAAYSEYDKIHVRWILPPSSWLYRTKSLEFLSWLFSYCGAGSLIRYLMAKKWASVVHGKVLKEGAWNTSLYSTLEVSVTLTQIGNSENKLNVLDAIFSYVNFLRRERPPKSIYDEIRIIKNAKFRFQDPDLRTIEDFEYLTEDMHRYPSTDFLAAPFLWYEYDPVSLSTCLDLMTPTKACIVLTDDYLGENFEALFAGPRQNEDSADIPENWIDRWQKLEPLPDFKLPEQNIFCPDDLRIIDAPTVLHKHPIKVHSDNMAEVWYKYDATLRMPKCRMNFCFLSPLPLESPDNAAMLDLFALILEELTFNERYLANIAGLLCKMRSCYLGLEVRLKGFTQKIPLLTQILARWISKIYHSLTKGLFESKKNEILCIYSEYFIIDKNLMSDIRQSILITGRWTNVEKHAALTCLSFERFQHFMEHFADHIYTKCLVQGNIAKADAVETVRKVVEVLRCEPPSRNIMSPLKINRIPRGNHCCTIKSMRPNNADVTVEHYYQFNNASFELKCILRYLSLSSMIRSFDTFGASDISMIEDLTDIYKKGVSHYYLGLTRPSRSTINAKRIESVDAEIEAKLLTAYQHLEDRVNSNNWNGVTEDVLRTMFKGDPISLDTFEMYWQDILNGDGGFDNVSRWIDALHEMHPPDVQKWFKYITDKSNICKLTLRVIGANYKRDEFSTVNTPSAEPTVGPNNIPLHQLQYLIQHAGGNTSSNCITDINEFRKNLEAAS